MPAGDPAGYLPSVKKLRKLAKATGGAAYVPRAKQRKPGKPALPPRRLGRGSA